MNYEEWLEIGKLVKTLHAAIHNEIRETQEAEYKKSSIEMKMIMSAEKTFCKMKSKLDDILCRQHYDKNLTHVFYGPIHE